MKDCPAAQEGRGFWSRDTEKTHCRLLISSPGTPDLIAEREFPGFSFICGKELFMSLSPSHYHPDYRPESSQMMTLV